MTTVQVKVFELDQHFVPGGKASVKIIIILTDQSDSIIQVSTIMFEKLEIGTKVETSVTSKNINTSAKSTRRLLTSVFFS